jgi:LPS export ABC transporter protein LptC
MRSVRPFVGLVLLAAGCAQQATGGATSASPAPIAAQPTASATAVPVHIETHGGGGQYVRIVETVRGRKAYTIRALSAIGERFGTNQATGALEQPHVTFVDRSGTTTIADAPKATVAERDKSVVMTGGVHARTSSGSLLSCDTLTYNANTERFHGEGHVRLTAPNGLQLGGDHLDGDVKLQDVRVTGSGG